MKTRAVGFSATIICGWLVACSSTPDPAPGGSPSVLDPKVEETTNGKVVDAGCAAKPKVGVCELSCGTKTPKTATYTSVDSAQVSALQKLGDGVCATGAQNCCVENSGKSSLCTNFQTDTTNCGACGVSCFAGQTCSAGACACPSPATACGKSCTDTTSDVSNCGACGNVCAAGDTCKAGVCTAPCTAGQTACAGVCTSTQSDPNNCGTCGHACTAGASCEAGGCVSPAQAASCLPTSSLSVLVTGGNVDAYVPNAAWIQTGTGIQLVPLEGSDARATIATPNAVNSCSCNSVTGQTVCTANNTDVYILSGSTLTTTLTSGATGSESFSGGTCQNCGVAIDSVANKAVISVGVAGAGGYQFLDLGTQTFSTPVPAGGETSEDILVDPSRHLVLSPNEANDYELLNTSTSTVFNFSPGGIGSGEFDSAAEDCTTGVALSSVEFTGDIFLTDLTQATMSGTTWSAPFVNQSLPEFASFSAGTDGIAVAPGSHVAIVAGEFGGTGFGVIQLPSTAGTGTPSIVDYAAANMPNDPTGTAWSMGLDPHTVTAYTSPNTGAALAVMANEGRSYLAVVDLKKLLAAARSGSSHNVDSTVDLVAIGAVTFVSIH